MFQDGWQKRDWEGGMEFEWDPKKAELNLKKHRVTFNDAATIFGDSQVLTLYDDPHSKDEERFVSLGLNRNGIALIVVHTYRVKNGDEIIRLISARKADNDEEAVYYGKGDANERPL